jgi:arylsulfatase A-like enzyme
MHVILYVLDALRADHLSCYGYERLTSPHIDSLARDGVIFTNCFTSTTWTRPVAASLLTGTYPGVHLTRTRYEKFSSHLASMPEIFAAGGFETAAFNCMGNLASEIGFNRGFDTYLDLFREPNILEKRRNMSASDIIVNSDAENIALPLAEDVNKYFFDWLEKKKTANTFSFIWTIDTHEPYQPLNEFRRYSKPTKVSNEGDTDDIRRATAKDRQRLIDLYDDEIYYNDNWIGEIIHFLREKGIYEEALFVVTGDHGEAFYDHGVYSHGHMPYDEIIRVPLIIKFPSNRYSDREIGGLVELIDIFPTLISYAGLDSKIPPDTQVQGEDLLPLVEGSCEEVRDFCYSDTQTVSYHNRYLSVRGKKWKYIKLQKPLRNRDTINRTLRHIILRGLLINILRSPRHFFRNFFQSADEFLFDLELDPGEKDNLYSSNHELVDHFRDILNQWILDNESNVDQSGFSPLSFEESELLQRHLEELGYM